MLRWLVPRSGCSAWDAQAEPPLDETWADPEAFGGCASAGQSRPDQPQPIHFVRNGAAAVQPRAA